MLPKIAKLLLPMAVVAIAQTPAQAQDLTDEQRAEIEARIAPVGEVCLQGENCGGLPKASTSMAAASKPASSSTAAPSGSTMTSSDSAAGDSMEGVAEGASTVSVDVAAAVANVDGEAIYNQACLACHASGVGGAPVVGDIDSWSPRLAKGLEALHNSGLNGVAGTAMMAKGGRADLSDEQVIAAVNYMVEASQ